MASVTGNQNLFGGLTGEIALSICQRSIFKRRVDAYLVLTILESEHISMGEAEPPGLLVIGRAIRDPVRIFRDGMQIWSQLTELKGSGYGHAVIDDVEVMPLKINNPDTTRVLNVCVADVPLLRNSPVEDRCTGGHFEELERNPFTNQVQCLPYPVARDATAYGVKTAGEAVQLAAELRAIFHFELT
jgi:hypothetical protein